jgi:hypothetical protein
MQHSGFCSAHPFFEPPLGAVKNNPDKLWFPAAPLAASLKASALTAMDAAIGNR